MKRIFATLDPFLESGPVLGRKVANAGFLSALLEADPFDEYHFFLENRQRAEEFLEQARERFPGRAGKLRTLARAALPGELARGGHHVFHLSDCICHQHAVARLRNLHAPKLFPVTGPIHSLSYADYPAAFLAHLWPGATPRDCIVCTSRRGEEVVRRQFEALRAGYGLDEQAHPGPTLRRIPLGTDPGALAPATGSERARAREGLGIPPGKVVLLVFGRISHHSKMDLLPLVAALARCAARGLDLGEALLMLGGWVADGENYHEAVAAMGARAGVEVRVDSRPDEARKAELFRAADVFISIADNPQETFGLSILEAKSAGLPVLASHYDGYRDLVRHGTDGLLVPTLADTATPDVDALAPVLFGSDSHLLLAQRTVVEVPALAEALLSLVRSPELRASMGAAGRRHLEREFTWARVVRRHLELWEELWTLPAERFSGPHPLEARYGALFGHYASAPAADDLALRLSPAGERVLEGRELPVVYPGLAQVVDKDGLRRVLFAARKPTTLGALAARLAPGPEAGLTENAGEDGLGGAHCPEGPRRAHGLSLARALVLWALKHDLLERAS
jgi:glycosyltransferase involved in cell wall biosynthesis